MGFDFLNFLSQDIAIDLGTANTLMHVKGKGLLLNEASVIAVKQHEHQIVAVGNAARTMWGKTPEGIMTVRPMKDGVIADFDLAEMMMKRFIKQMNLRQWMHPRMAISIPSGITEVERRAVRDSGEHAGARQVYLVEEPMAAAIGVGLPVDEAVGSMVVDIGGGTTEIGVTALSGLVTKISIRIGGDEMNDAVVQHFKKRHSLLLGEMQGEKIKMEIGSTRPHRSTKTMEVRGRDIISGIPRTVTATSEEVQEALEEPVLAIIDAVRLALEKTPPELSADILDRGIILTGGGGLLKGLDTRLREETQVPVSLADEPLLAVVRGVGAVLDDIDRYQKVLNLRLRR